MEDGSADVLSTISHDIRAPLGVVLVAVSELLDPGLGALTDEQRALVLLIRRSSERLSRLSTNVHLLNRIALGKAIGARQLEDAREITRAVVDTAERAGEVGRLRAHFEAPPTRVEVDVDQETVRAALANVLANALRFARSEVRVLVTSEASRALVTIEDDGPGFTEPPVSSGLGLRIARGVLDAHGGELETSTIRDSAGVARGARVCVALPRSRAHDHDL